VEVGLELVGMSFVEVALAEPQFEATVRQHYFSEECFVSVASS